MVHLVQGECCGCARGSRGLPLITPNTGEARRLQASLVHAGHLQALLSCTSQSHALGCLGFCDGQGATATGYDLHLQEQRAAWRIGPQAVRNLWCLPAH